MAGKKSIPNTLFKRSSKLLSMATKVAGKEVKKRINDQLNKNPDSRIAKELQTRIQQAEIIAESLSQLKGAAMKAGQLLSIDANEYLPPAVIEILSQLQDKAESFDYAEIDKVLKTELSPEQLKKLNIQTKAIAAASIGQVHRAQYFPTPKPSAKSPSAENNPENKSNYSAYAEAKSSLAPKEIVLKVQYPGVADSIDQDLKILEKACSGFLTVSGKKIDLHNLFGELGQVLKWETDYTRERYFIWQFYEALKNDDNYIVPKPIDEISTGKVLAMEFIEGQRLSDWIKQETDPVKKQHLGHLVLDLFCREFLEFGIIQTDPNFGNFLIQEDPFKLVLLDFGATLEYSPKFQKDYKEVLRKLFTGSKKEIIDIMIAQEYLDPRESKEVQDHFYRMLTLSVKPFFPEEQPFQFSDLTYERATRESIQKFTSSLRYSPPPRKVLFLHRKLGGIFSWLKRMEIKMDLSEYWQRMID